MRTIYRCRFSPATNYTTALNCLLLYVADSGSELWAICASVQPPPVHPLLCISNPILKCSQGNRVVLSAPVCSHPFSRYSHADYPYDTSRRPTCMRSLVLAYIRPECPGAGYSDAVECETPLLDGRAPLTRSCHQSHVLLVNRNLTH